jgi:hypothetical protein
MEVNGWLLRAENDAHDVELVPVAYMLTTTYYYYGGYWGGWYGWYYPYPVTSSYTTGSLVTTMVDQKDLDIDGKGRAVWNFIINGLLEGSSATFTTRYVKGIDQAYTQSPYLKIN